MAGQYLAFVSSNLLGQECCVHHLSTDDAVIYSILYKVFDRAFVYSARISAETIIFISYNQRSSGHRSSHDNNFHIKNRQDN